MLQMDQKLGDFAAIFDEKICAFCAFLETNLRFFILELWQHCQCSAMRRPVLPDWAQMRQMGAFRSCWAAKNSAGRICAQSQIWAHFDFGPKWALFGRILGKTWALWAHFLLICQKLGRIFGRFLASTDLGAVGALFLQIWRILTLNFWQHWLNLLLNAFNF